MGEQRIERKAIKGTEVVDVIEWRGEHGTAQVDELHDPRFYSRWTTALGRRLQRVESEPDIVWLVDDANDLYQVQP